MPNTNRPDDTRCFDGCNIGRDIIPAGVCIHCNLGTCAFCAAPMTSEQCAESRAECQTPARNEVFCPACLAEIKGEAVPVAVDEELTVRLPREPIGAAGLGEVLAERGREWAERKAAAL
jgi:hypothetical protein